MLQFIGEDDRMYEAHEEHEGKKKASISQGMFKTGHGTR